MRVIPVSRNLINNNKNQSKDTSFGRNVVILTKDFEVAKKGIRSPLKLRQLDALKDFLVKRKRAFDEVVKRIQQETGIARALYSPIGIKFKMAKGGVPEVSVQIRTAAAMQDNSPIVISKLFNKDGTLKSANEKRLLDAVEAKARESAKIGKEVAAGNAFETLVKAFDSMMPERAP